MEKMRRNKNRRLPPPTEAQPRKKKPKKAAAKPQRSRPSLPPSPPSPPPPENREDFFDFSAPVQPTRPQMEMKRLDLPAAAMGIPEPPPPAPTQRRQQGRRYRMTTRENRRRRRKRALMLLALLVIAIVGGILLSINVLFKVQNFRVENFEKGETVDTGIYTQEQIIGAAGIDIGSNLFAFSSGGRASALCKQLPYLDKVEVRRSLPDTVIIRVTPAVERYCVKTQQGWATLSSGFRVLSMVDQRKNGLIFLRADNVQAPEVGESIRIESEPTEPTKEADSSDSASAQAKATPTPAPDATTEDLTTLTSLLESESLLDKVTQIDVRNIVEITVVYDGRITLDVGTANNLAYKMQIAGYILRNDNGDALSDTDKGTLDVSHVKADGTIDAVFSPAA